MLNDRLESHRIVDFTLAFNIHQSPCYGTSHKIPLIFVTFRFALVFARALKFYALWKWASSAAAAIQSIWMGNRAMG